MKERGSNLPTVHVNWITITGGVGDQIGRMPPVRYVIEQYPHVSIHLVVPDYFEEFANHIFADLKHCVFVKPLSRALTVPASFNPNLPAKSFDEQAHSAIHTHTTDHAFHIYADIGNYPKSARNYPRIRPNEVPLEKFGPLPERFVVLTTGHTSDVKEWPAKEVNKVAAWLIEQGITPLFLGAEKPSQAITSTFSSEVDFNVGVNLVNKTSLLEATAIMGRALAVCGVDGALIHYAAATDVPIIVGYTFVNPKHRLPIRYDKTGGGCYVIEPPKSLACRFCQDKYHFVYNHLFTTCYHGDLACTASMTAERFIAKLKQILK